MLIQETIAIAQDIRIQEYKFQSKLEVRIKIMMHDISSWLVGSYTEVLRELLWDVQSKSSP